MRRPVKILLWIAGAVAALVVVLVIAALIVVQTQWFRDVVRGKIVAEVEKSTGGRAGIGAFRFSPWQLRAEVDNFVLHGTEGPNEPPLLTARSLVVVVKILSVIHHKADLDTIAIDQPQVYVKVNPDGSTNLPAPKEKSTSNKDPIQTVLDLAVRHFNLSHGLVRFADRKTPLDIRGENLQAVLRYNTVSPSYTGRITMAPMYVQSGRYAVLPVNIDLPLKIAKGRIDLTNARFETPESRVTITANVLDLNNPGGNVHVNGRLSPAELARSFSSSVPPEVQRAPPVDLQLAASMANNTVNVVGLQAGMGSSDFDASGVITDLKRMIGSLRFRGKLDVTQIGRILRVSSRPEGLVLLNGEAKLDGASNYAVDAKLDARGVTVTAGKTRIRNVSAGTNVGVVPNRIELNGMRVAALGGTLTGSGSLVNMDRFRLDAALHGFNVKYLAQTYASPKFVWDGTVNGPVHVRGALKGAGVARQLIASARLGITPGTQGAPLSGLIDAAYDGPRDTVNLGNSFLALAHSRLDLNGTIGTQLNIRLVSRDLNDFLPALAMTSPNPPKELPIALAGGAATFNGNVQGSPGDPRINGRVDLTNFLVNQEKFDRFGADLAAAKTGASVRNAALTRGPLRADLDASVGLRDWKTVPQSPVSAHASIRNANLQDLMALAGKQDAQVKGVLNASGQASGTIGEPRATADAAITNAVAYRQPFERISAHVNYTGRAIELTKAQVVSGQARLDADAVYTHDPKQFRPGQVKFHLASNGIRLDQLKPVQEARPDLAGVLQMNADGAGMLEIPAPNRPAFVPQMLSANVSARGLAMRGKPLGNLNATANTRGQDLVFRLESDIAQSNVRGDGTWRLAGDYPVNAQLSFDPVHISAIRSLLSQAAQADGRESLDGVVRGHLRVSGPAFHPAELRGTLEIPTLQLTASTEVERGVVGSGARRNFALRNAGPIVATLDGQVVDIRNARLVGNSTNFSATGAVYLSKGTLNVHVNGDIGLEIAQAFDPDIFSSGNVVLTAAIQGPLSQPSINGRLQLRDASFNLQSAPQGISNANGAIAFNGQQVLIENITGESGGGKINLAGFFRYGGPVMQFRLQARADQVRVRYPQTITTKVNAALDLAGTSKNSLLSGDVSVTEVAMHSHTDIGNVLSSGGTPAATPSASTGPLANMRFDVRVNTAPDIQFQTPLAENLQAAAHLRVRGTPSRLGMLGRVDISQGDIMFFGSKYTISRGVVSFYNPQRVEPVLDVDLQTKAKGVDVSLMVTGPMNNLKLTYRSDPPMQFSDIVGLLATGKLPTTDPVLAAQQPPAPQQSFEQMGASALLGQAVAAPLSGRLERLFGVTKLKIDPQIIGPENTPQARLTLEQQISRDLVFTYIQDLRNSNPQTIRIEWAIDPAWSAVALRQENGKFGLDFYYKRRFR